MSADWRFWTPDEEARLGAMLADGLRYPEIAAALGRAVPSVRFKAKHMGINPKATRAGAAPFTFSGVTLERREGLGDAGPVAVLVPAETADEPDDAFLARVCGATRRAVAHAKAERFATVRIASDRPIALSISSDWHLSASGATDVEGLVAYAEATRDTPGAYACVVGDLTDNAIKHRGGAGPQSVPDELRLADILVGRFGRKLLWMTSGNHDDWTKAFAGVDSLAALAARKRVHYAPDELFVVVEIVAPDDPDTVTARWVVATRHQYRRGSMLNYTHACWRWLEEMVNDHPADADGRTLLPDVIAIGHNHVAAVETRSTPRGDVIACRMGAWQSPGGYARALGFPGSRPTAPTVILPPTRAERPTAYADYAQAYAALRAGG